jgi:lysophospholipase L1-like esterase
MSKNLCIWGDSITWGADDTEYGGWVNRLRLFVENQGIDVSVYNLGISGNTTEDLLRRFKAEAKIREVDVIVFAIGINDSRYIRTEDNPQVSLRQYETNLGELIKQAREFTNAIAFIGITMVDERKCKPRSRKPDNYYDNKRIVSYNAALKSFCINNKLLYLDMFNVVKENDLPDGLHPDAKGHRKMFEQIKIFILPLLISDS